MSKINQQDQYWFKDKITSLAAVDKNVVALWLYGSFAKNTANEHSDIDLAVMFGKPICLSRA